MSEVGRDGDAALAAMLAAVQGVLAEARRPSHEADDSAIAARLHALHADFDAHWAAVRAAAATLDGGGAVATPQPASDAEMQTLLEERRTLRATLHQRNRTLKVQIDQLRSALCDIRMMDSSV